MDIRTLIGGALAAIALIAGALLLGIGVPEGARFLELAGALGLYLVGLHSEPYGPVE